MISKYFFLIVALNFQTPGLPMDLQNGKFLDNGSSGYLLKPQFLRDNKTQFNPNKPPKQSDPVTLTIRVRLTTFTFLDYCISRRVCVNILSFTDFL